MGIHVVRCVADLGDTYVLAPERYDPRRALSVVSTRCLMDVADIITENTTTKALPTDKPILVLNTTHAYEGFVVLRHKPVERNEIASAKRKLLPGDVIISRLRPYLRQVAFVDEKLFHLAPCGNDVCASTEFFIIRGKGGFDAAALVPFLLSEPVQKVLSAGQEGGHHPRFSKDLLDSIQIPDCVFDGAPDTTKRVRKLAAGMRRSLVGSRTLITEIEAQISAIPDAK